MIKAFSSNGADQSLGEAVLPRASWSNQHFLNAHAFHAALEAVAIDSVPIPDRKVRCRILGKSFQHLLGRPAGGWMFGDVEVNYLSSVVSQDNEYKQDLESDRWHNEEVNGNELSSTLCVDERIMPSNLLA